MTLINPGDQAPDFALKDQNGKEIQLSHNRGNKVLLSFHPLAWTKVCAEQMKSLEQHWHVLEKAHARAFGLSVDSVPCKKAWADHLGIRNIQLLSDFWPHGEVSGKYGLFREKDGFSERANVVIDEDQKVVMVKVYPISQLPDIGEVLEIMQK
ncbi:MAG: peroxiredoxin [Theionarchaea archaeon]|nr:peroxiredoxin [Theionarchaea archaeon]MBU7000390.1 peroxiredoxin [Theionarchaea archaeon]MBU7021232.1 peroxiredoxin [Theionarchaea archaeon]MBU7035729.1 peroxiredoxin [Theionarchaea archaeon]MBU7039724.1 peroxiredoxin [Theionarchaea archaeon]